MSELLELFPAPWEFVNGIIHVPAFRRIDIPPVILRVPVGLGEVGSYLELVFSECFEHVFQHVALGIVLEGMLGNGEVGLPTVEHAESVVVLGGENHVFHAGVVHRLCPLFGVELGRVELLGKAPIPVFVLLIGHGGVACDPVFINNGPRLHDARYGIEPPMDEHSEFEVLPCFEVFDYILFFGPLIGG